jgi:Helicase C-terminal domain
MSSYLEVQVIEGFRAEVARGRRGALLMAVCQGRVSEGIDFSDAEGRCVVVAGIPFAPAKNARVLCKRQVRRRARLRANFVLRSTHLSLTYVSTIAVCSVSSQVLDTSGQSWRVPVSMAAPRGRVSSVIMHNFTAIHYNVQVLDERRRQGVGALTGQAWYTLSAMRVVNQALGRVIRHSADYGAILLADERFGRPDMRQGISFWARAFLTVRDGFKGLPEELEMFYRVNERSTAAAAPKAALKLRGDGGAAMFGKAATGGARGAAAAAQGAPHARRQPFVLPKRGGGGYGGALGPLAKAGAADHGGSALQALEGSMRFACAKDVYGLGAMSQCCSQPAAALAPQVCCPCSCTYVRVVQRALVCPQQAPPVHSLRCRSFRVRV